MDFCNHKSIYFAILSPQTFSYLKLIGSLIFFRNKYLILFDIYFKRR
jgi:hypothetical protein